MHIISRGTEGFTRTTCDACGTWFEYHENHVYEELVSFGRSDSISKYVDAIRCPVCTGVICIKGE